MENLETLVKSLTAKVVAMEGSRSLQTVGAPSSGDTAWMLAATAFALLLSLPGVAIFYAGMVKTEDVYETVLQVLTIASVITVLWLCFGYSLAFGPSAANNTTGNMLFGGNSRLWLRGLRYDSFHQLAPTIPESVFCTYELTFAIFTAAIIFGPFAKRVRFWPAVLFFAIWHLTVYCPTAHSVWHPLGFLYQEGVMDYAGGSVVHISAGMSGLAVLIALGIGNRSPKIAEQTTTYNVLTFIGLALLWVGWFGFDSGKAYGANYRAGYSMLITQIAVGTSALSWAIVDMLIRNKINGEDKLGDLLGVLNGAFAGLITISPACGFVDPTGAFIIGLLAGSLCKLVAWGKAEVVQWHYDLESFGVHAIGGAIGMFMTGCMATHMSGSGLDGWFYNPHKVFGGHKLGIQMYATVVVGGWAFFMSFVIAFLLNITIGFKEEEPTVGEAVKTEEPTSAEGKAAV